MSVAEFAKAAGKSQQAIYKRLNNQLKPFIQLVDNQRMLEIRALWEVYGIVVEQPIQPKLNNQFNQDQGEEIRFLRGQVELLQAELAKEREHNRELSDKIAVLADRAQQTANNAQLLHAGAVKQLTDGKPPGFWSTIFGKQRKNAKTQTGGD